MVNVRKSQVLGHIAKPTERTKTEEEVHEEESERLRRLERERLDRMKSNYEETAYRPVTQSVEVLAQT